MLVLVLVSFATNTAALLGPFKDYPSQSLRGQIGDIVVPLPTRLVSFPRALINHHHSYPHPYPCPPSLPSPPPPNSNAIPVPSRSLAPTSHNPPAPATKRTRAPRNALARSARSRRHAFSDNAGANGAVPPRIGRSVRRDAWAYMSCTCACTCTCVCAGAVMGRDEEEYEVVV